MFNRLKRLRAKLAEADLDGFLVTYLPNIHYLCGFTGSNGMLLVTRKASYFYTDFRYKEQVRSEIRTARTIIRARDLVADFPVEQTNGVRRLGFEQAFLAFGAYASIRKQLKGTKLIPCENLTAELRVVKDENEIRSIARAAAIADRVLKAVLPMVKPGVTERDLSAEIDHRFTRAGGIAFETIVASGPRGALPHGRPTRKKLKAGEAVVFDMGARGDGYCSDMTRTVFVGKADRRSREIYEIVLEAQLRALGGVRSGADCRSVDALAREHIATRGYGPQFGHGLGHGVGLEVHERPTLSARSRDILKAGSVVTVEPGIYLPGWGGVRIEDLVVVTRQGCRILSQTSKRLLEV